VTGIILMRLCGGISRVTQQEEMMQAGQNADTETSTENLSIKGLEEQLTALQTQAKEYLEGWQRARADFANYKKRVERELQDSHQNASVDLLGRLFPILNDFERAMSNLPPELKDHAWLEGITLIQRKFQKLLEDNGVVEIDPTGEPFDPNFHEAVGTDEDTAAQSGYVTATLQKGYQLGDRVLRPALVRVAR
jgi:molecular chaperone GrpE